MAGLYYAPGETTEDLIKQGRINPQSYTGTEELPLSLVSQNLTSALHGQLPADVQNLLAQRAAEIGVGSGTSGSEFNKFRSLRDLGLTSIGRQDEATRMLLPFFGREQEQRSAANEAYQNRVAAQRSRVGPLNTETSAPLYQPRTGSVAPSGGGGRMGMPHEADPLLSLIQEIGQKYGPGGSSAGMAPMGAGTIPSYGGSWNAGPLDVGGGTFFAGSPEELSTEEQWQYGMVPGLTPEEQASYAVNPSENMGTFTGDINLPEEDIIYG